MKPRFGELTVILRVCSSTRTCKHVVALFESCCLQQCWPSKEPPHVAALGVGKRREAIRKDKKRRLTALEKEAPPFTYLQLVDDMWGDPRERLATAIAGPANVAGATRGLTILEEKSVHSASVVAKRLQQEETKRKRDEERKEKAKADAAAKKRKAWERKAEVEARAAE